LRDIISRDVRGKNYYVMYGECGADGSVYADTPVAAMVKVARALSHTVAYIAAHFEPIGHESNTTIQERLERLRTSYYYATTEPDAGTEEEIIAELAAGKLR
jgi:hypothetical protein